MKEYFYGNADGYVDGCGTEDCTGEGWWVI